MFGSHDIYICLGQSFKIVLNTNFNSLFYAWVHGDMFDTLNSAGKVLLSCSPSLLFSFRSFFRITILIISINTSSQFLSTLFLQNLKITILIKKYLFCHLYLSHNIMITMHIIPSYDYHIILWSSWTPVGKVEFVEIYGGN